MKNIFLFTLIIFSIDLSFSQTNDERQKIISNYDIFETKLVKQKFDSLAKSQGVLLNDFINVNPILRFNSELGLPQRVYNGQPYYYQTDNVSSAFSIRANSLYPGGSLGLNVTGQGINVGVWDGGKVRNTHQEFGTRVVLGDGSSTLSSHATHVTGTVIASGVVASRKGIGYQANAITYDWTNDIGEMVSFGANGYLISNHSYGNIASSLASFVFGSYNGQSIEVDEVMNAFPYYQIVKSAGNDRNNSSLSQVSLKGGYDLLTGVSNAKNVLTIAAVEHVGTYTDAGDVVMSSFSNFGPTDDGRIKPDICAKGVGIFSTNTTSNTAYTQLSGTSMSAPAVSGLIALLQKHYNNLNPNTYMKSASVRSLLCQSVREAGQFNGLDYEFGFGLADGFNAANVITQKGSSSIFSELTLSDTSTYNSTFTINSTQKINIVIGWTDPVGFSNGSAEDNRSPRLVNNLDLKVLKDGITYYPWKLNPDDPSSAATNTSDNEVDNIEKIEIYNATPGTYTIQINHKGSLQNGSQDFTLIATSTNGITLNNQDFISDNNFFVYPNPANNELYFSNPNNVELSAISISDISGKQVVTVMNAENTDYIDVSNLQSGVYFVKFTTDTTSIVKKFIKK